jgi:hypothetical protein
MSSRKILPRSESLPPIEVSLFSKSWTTCVEVQDLLRVRYTETMETITKADVIKQYQRFIHEATNAVDEFREAGGHDDEEVAAAFLVNIAKDNLSQVKQFRRKPFAKVPLSPENFVAQHVGYLTSLKQQLDSLG